MIEVTEEKRNKFTLDILCNGALYRQVYCSMFQGRLSLPQRFSSQKEVEVWFFEEEYKIGKNYLLYLLGKQDYLSTVLIRKFREKKFSADTYERLIDEFIDLGYIQDENLVIRMIKGEMAKDKGPIATFAKLKAKGIDAKIIQNHLQKLMTNVYQKEKIEKHALKMRSKGFDEQKMLMRLYRLGFEIELIRASI